MSLIQHGRRDVGFRFLRPEAVGLGHVTAATGADGHGPDVPAAAHDVYDPSLATTRAEIAFFDPTVPQFLAGRRVVASQDVGPAENELILTICRLSKNGSAPRCC